MNWPTREFILGAAETSEVLQGSFEHKLAIRGLIDNKKLTLLMGNGDIVKVPLECFEPNAEVAPDFNEFSIVDYGNTLRFGYYEASVESVLKYLEKT